MIATAFSSIALFASVVYFHKTFTSPQPPAPKEQQAKGQEIVRGFRVIAILSKGMLWPLYIGEILACLSSTSWFTDSGLSTLVQYSGGELGSCLTHHKAQALYPGAKLPVQVAIGASLTIIGGIVRISSHRALGRHYTWEVSLRDGHKLITSGPYAYVRHPGYSSRILLLIGQVVLMRSSGTFLQECVIPIHPLLIRSILWLFSSLFSALVVLVLYRTGQEDKILQRKFGKAWDEWVAKTPRLIPGIL